MFGSSLKVVNSFKYISHIICIGRSVDGDIKREIRKFVHMHQYFINLLRMKCSLNAMLKLCSAFYLFLWNDRHSFGVTKYKL